MSGLNLFSQLVKLTEVLEPPWVSEPLEEPVLPEVLEPLEEPVLPEVLEPPWVSEPLEGPVLPEVLEPPWTSGLLEVSQSAERPRA